MPLDPFLAPIRRLAMPLVVVLLFVVVYVTSLAYGSTRSELITAPDEASHYVTALMIRSYVLGGFEGPPRQFAEEYYLHYPKVAFGVWPPLFHLLLGAWLLVTGPALSSALLFVSLTTTMVCALMVGAVRTTLGLPLAAATAFWFATMPGVQIWASAVMLDMLCALFLVGAAVAFARYMDSERTRDAVLFGTLASAAILTKYNALALALLPPVAIAASRRWRLVRRGNLWLMPVVVAVLCAPWYLVQSSMVRYASEPVPTGNAWMAASRLNLSEIVTNIGVVALPLIAIGLAVRVVRRSADHALWCSLFALAVVLWVFHSLLYPISESRYLLALFVACALFAAAGLHWMVMQMPWPRAAASTSRGWLAAGTVVVMALVTFSPPPRRERGFGDAASLVLPRLTSPHAAALVSSDPLGEGAFVARAAEHQLAERSFVLRGSKLLASDTWMGLNYSVRYADGVSTLKALDQAQVAYVVVDDASRDPHHRLLTEAVSTSAHWTLERETRGVGAARTGPVRIYARTNPLPPEAPRFELQTGYTLGHNLRAPQKPEVSTPADR